MRRISFAALAAAIVFAAPASRTQTPHEAACTDSGSASVLIVDTDMGMDDVRAILALIGSPGVRIAAAVATEGSASAAKGADNLIGLLESAGAGDLPVFRGAQCGLPEPPQWRGHAESLGGHPFPPPRRMTQESLADAVERGAVPGGTWLALGPLSSLAAIERAAPGTLAGLEIWMPARLDGGSATGWNLGADVEAARSVLASAGRVFIVDAAGDMGRDKILSSVEGDSPAARWIAATAGAGAHSFIFDELAAAAVAAPDIFEIQAQRFDPAGIEGERLSLEMSDTGRISIVRLKDAAALESFLHGAWESPTGYEHAHSHGGVSGGPGSAGAGAADPIARMREFHGHLGPYVVLGFRMGRVALERTGSPGHFEIRAEVHSVLSPPRSCLIDGVQLGSGCTLGKRNISIEPEDGPPFAVFSAAGRSPLTVRLRDHIPAMIQASIDSIGVEATGMRIWEMDAGELFEFTGGR